MRRLILTMLFTQSNHTVYSYFCSRISKKTLAADTKIVTRLEVNIAMQPIPSTSKSLSNVLVSAINRPTPFPKMVRRLFYSSPSQDHLSAQNKLVLIHQLQIHTLSLRPQTHPLPLLVPGITMLVDCEFGVGSIRSKRVDRSQELQSPELRTRDSQARSQTVCSISLIDHPRI